MKRTSLIFVILIYTKLIFAEDFTIKKFFFSKPEICKGFTKQWISLEGKIFFELNKIKYFHLFHYKDGNFSDLPEIITLKFKIVNCKNKNNFILLLTVKAPGQKFFQKFIITSEKEFNKIEKRIKKYLIKLFPLTGEVINIKNEFVLINLGKNYDVKEGDILFIKFENNIYAAIEVIKTFEYYSKAIITKQISSIENGFKVITFNNDLANKLNSYNFDIKKIKFNNLKLTDITGDDFIIEVSPHYCVVSYENGTGLIELKKLKLLKISEKNYNYVKKIKISRNEHFAGIIIKNIQKNIKYLMVIDLRNLKKYFLFKNKINNRYSLIKAKEINLYKGEYVNLSDFYFDKNDNLIFYDINSQRFYKLSNNKFNSISIDNLLLIKEVNNILLLENQKILLIDFTGFFQDKNILVKNLISGEETILNNIKWKVLNHLQTDIFYQKEERIIKFNIYTQKKEILLKEAEDYKKGKLTFSERNLILLKNNRVDIYNINNKSLNIDIFRKGKLKLIKEIDIVKNKNNLILSGRLYDYDKNSIIDYRDENSIILYDFINKKINSLISNIEKFYFLSYDSQFMIYKKKNNLYFTSIQYEEIK